MIIWLISANELDNDYNHVPLFTSVENQSLYFAQRRVKTLDDYMYQRKNNLVFNIDMSLEEIENVNYLITLNENNKKYFYFIVDKEYINDGVTKVYLQLDVMQTYMFDIKFNECFIEREHCNRWIKYTDGRVEPLDYLEDENLETGEYVLKSEETIYNYSGKGTYIYTSSERLGVSNDGRPNFNKDNEGGDSGGSSTSGENFKNGYADKNGMLFLKSVEGFRSQPYNLGDGTLTIGYGVTEKNKKEYYDRLYPSCTEEQASIVLGELMYNDFSKLVKINLDLYDYNWEHMTQGLFNAMTSFAYNSGVYGLMEWDIWELILNQSDYETIAKEWETTNIMVGSIYEEGLRNRRKKEADMIRGTFDYSTLLISNDGNGYITENNGYGYIPNEYK